MRHSNGFICRLINTIKGRLSMTHDEQTFQELLSKEQLMNLFSCFHDLKNIIKPIENLTSDMILLVVLFELLIFGVSAGHWKGVWVLSGAFCMLSEADNVKQVRKVKIVLCCSAGALLSTTVCLVVVWGVWGLSGVSGCCVRSPR